MRPSAPPLIGIFRSRLQADVLTRVLLDPRLRTVTQLAAEIASSVKTVLPEVNRLERAGVVQTTRVGRARVVTANDTNPAIGPLRQLVLMTFGPQLVVQEEFAGLEGIGELAIFGSWAARYHGDSGPVPGDIDVLVVGDPDRNLVFEAAERSEKRLGRAVNPTVVSSDRWSAAAEPFLQEIRRRPLVTIALPTPTVAA